ncbi:hypothetical protein ACTTAM_07040 [Rhodobacter capsulatus]|uniref:hypothetical protein n=1 Tax=Rhodobacter capsulatus TaxID=1061 RepID=UPI004024FDF7
MPERLQTFQWHGAEITTLPEGGGGAGGKCGLRRAGDPLGASRLGMQFHIEITETTVADWQEIPAYAESLRRALGEARAAGLAAEVAPHLDAFRATATRMNAALARAMAG